MAAGHRINVTEIIDRGTISAFQIALVVSCALVAMLDGFDTQAIAYVAPALAREWSIDVSSFGPVFGAGLLGLAAGAFLFGPLADRFGRRTAILLCTAIFGIFALGTGTSRSFTSLMVWRFLTGLGLGGAMPNIIALTAEYTPARYRATVITIMFCGFPLGSTLGGLLSAYLIPRWGWQAVFWLGGALPLVLVFVLFRVMPESIRFLVARGDAPQKVAQFLNRITRRASFTADQQFTMAEDRPKGFPVRLLFSEGWAATTVLLWLAFFMNLLVMYFLVNWMPALFQQRGLPVTTAIMSTAILNLGGVIGAILLGRLIDRFAPHKILAAAYAAAAVFIAGIALARSETSLLMLCIFCAGFGIVGAQISMNALAASFYPTPIRSTGVGWALGIGRIGSIVGPTVAGSLLAAGWGASFILSLATCPATIAALAVALLGRSKHSDYSAQRQRENYLRSIYPLRPQYPIAIIGGGIGGLTLAIALRQRGVVAEVFEQADEMTEIGAAVALSANATRELRRLGVLDAIAAVATEPTELIYRDWRSARRIAAHPIRHNLHYQERFGAPFYGIHRADLQRILSGALGDAGLHLGHQLVSLTYDGSAVNLTFANGHIEQASLVIGADGIRSMVREYVTGGEAAFYTGTSGFRGIVPVNRLPSLPDPHAIQFWMGPNAHLLHYAIGGAADAVNFLAVVEGPAIWPEEDKWLTRIEPGDAAAAFKGWHPAVMEMVGAVEHEVRWGLFALRPLIRWFRGRVVLLGDASHAMLPHQGQGANTAIEDAIILAELLARASPGDLDGVLQRYQVLRRSRTRKIQRSSWVTNGLLHLPDGPLLAERDRKMSRFPEDFGWIHEFDSLHSISEKDQRVMAESER